MEGAGCSARDRAAIALGACLALAAAGCGGASPHAERDDIATPGRPIELEVRQLTFGPFHHLYGYIGHAGNTPASGDDRWLAVLRVPFQDRLPGAADAAAVVLLDAERDFAPVPIDTTRAWNPQQGTMLYWNPDAPRRELFFNDRDPATGKVFTVRYDVEARRRVREYRFDDTPIGNAGVSQTGGAFAALNYARLARLRPVTGYAEAWDWTDGELAPADDGVFVVDVASGRKDLIASFGALRDVLSASQPAVRDRALYVNHTLWNRDGDRIFFFLRGAPFLVPGLRTNEPFVVRPDGGGLTRQPVFIGGHPEWEKGARMIGAFEGRLVLYDTDAGAIVATIGPPEAFPDPEGDTALSPDGRWIVNGWSDGAANRYTVFRRSDAAYVHTEPFDRGAYTIGPLRIDGAPTWSRASDAVFVLALAPDGTRQLFRIALR
ncbi:MAG: hypothetical protein KDB35_06565 [Acidimicrobiales bacterium]|nr:hypothetical protein [Acidimicrobiales bacterium]